MQQAPLLRFLGAAGTVTGSRFLVDTGHARVMVDCGMYQGLREYRDRNWAPLPVDPASIDAVVLTHAHLDHCGYLPVLVRNGFAGAVHTTGATADLTRIVLADSARLQEEEAGYANRKGFSKHHPALPLYTEEDARVACDRLAATPVDEDVDVAAGVSVRLRRAGHILGSATATLTLRDAGTSVLFSGDLGRPNHPLLQPPADPPAVDVMVVESTYGDRRHEDEETELHRFADALERTFDRRGVVVIPAFAVDRTEVMLLHLGRLMADGRVRRVPVFVDSPMGLAVLDVYRAAIAARDPELRPLGGSADPFDPVHMVRQASTAGESRAINQAGPPAIIVSSSGMVTGGRVLHHLARCLPDARNTVVLVGFQSAGTRGRLLADGALAVKMLGRYVPVRAEIVDLEAFSVHADADELVEWIGRSPRAPQATYLVHGEPEGSRALQRRLRDDLDRVAVIPTLDEAVRLD